MRRHYSAVLTLILNVIFDLNDLQVETAASNVYNDNDLYRYPVVYRRFIRRRPPMYPDDWYMEEIVEIFDTKEKPPAYGTLMTDTDVDQFIFCDFNRHLDKCKQYWKLKDQRNPFFPRSTRPKTAVIKSSPTHESSTHLADGATGSSKFPDLSAEEYNYADEIQEVATSEQEYINIDDYYAEENDY